MTICPIVSGKFLGMEYLKMRTQGPAALDAARPAGVDIPQNFAYLNYKSLGAGGTLKSRLVQMMITRNYRHLAKSKDRVKEGKPNGRASVCTKCGACVPKCPQKIAIPQELERVKAVFEQGKSVKTI